MQETLIDRLYEALRPDWTIWGTEFTEQATTATTEDYDASNTSKRET